jgi:hypothetical protein
MRDCGSGGNGWVLVRLPFEPRCCSASIGTTVVQPLPLVRELCRFLWGAVLVVFLWFVFFMLLLNNANFVNNDTHDM